MNRKFNTVHNQYGDVGSSREEELNQRISSRNVPSKTLQPYISNRPMSTKYNGMLFIDSDKPSTVNLSRNEVYNQGNTFNPGSSAPWNGYSQNIDTEIKLRGAVFPLQKCAQSKYIPSSSSDLYNVSVASSSNTIRNQHQLLSERPILSSSRKTTGYNDTEIFNNDTRQNIRNT